MKCTLLLLIITLLTHPFATAKGTERKLDTINVQLKWRHQFQFAGYYAAIEQGYYENIGLNVNLIERLPGPTPIDHLITGQVNYAIGGIGALAYRVNGVPLVALAATYQHTPSILISRFANINELKGKKIMLSKGIMNAEIITLLQQHGLASNDYEVVPSSQSIEGFINGDIDAYNGYITNEIYQLKQRNVPHYHFSPRNNNATFYGDILLTTEKHIKQNSEQVEAFRNATLKGWEYAISHPTEMIKLIQAKYNTQNKSFEQLDVEAHELIKLIHSDIVPIGYMHRKRWLAIAKVLQNSGHLTDKTIDIDGFLYSEYTNDNWSDFIAKHLTAIVILTILTIAMLLLLYNYRLKRMVNERTRQLTIEREKAEKDARTDLLTGIANRRSFMETFEHVLAISRRNNLALSLIYIDIDWFKDINDTHGHPAGDAALKRLGEILQSNARSSDTPARIGGEEFNIICLEKNQKDAIHLAERLRKEVESEVFVYQQLKFTLTLSLGVASVTQEDTLATALKKCDAALYKAKELGRNQVQWL